MAIFLGRPAAKLSFFCAMGDRIPGASGAKIAEQFLGEIPPDLLSVRTVRRYPAVLAKIPRLFATIPARIKEAARQTDQWWRSEIALAPSRDLDAALRQMIAGRARMQLSISLTGEAALAGAQPVFDQLVRLAESIGRPELAAQVLRGHGSHVETRLVDDLWEFSRNRLGLAEFLARHGFHGPLEGEIAARVWREDPTPVHALAQRYASQPDSVAPAEAARVGALEGDEAARVLLSALPFARRPIAHAALKLARTYLPLRGVGKIPFLQSLDVIRAGARRVGKLLADDGQIDSPDDVCYLLLDELCEGSATDWLERIRARRRERAEYERLDIPMIWHGTPPASSITSSSETREQTDVLLRGIGASPGVIEGRIRVVTDAVFAEVEEGEILVATTTDPSWASVLFFAAALVVDIGGALSHAAVVAREMGVPCVMGTDVATATLRTGDLTELTHFRSPRHYRTRHPLNHYGSVLGTSSANAMSADSPVGAYRCRAPRCRCAHK